MRQEKVIDLGTPAATQQGRRRAADVFYSGRIEEQFVRCPPLVKDVGAFVDPIKG